MGSATSTAKTIKDEFARITKGDKKKAEHLNLSHLVQFQAKDRDHFVDPTHLGTLFVMDTNLDGKFELDEMIRVGQMYSERASRNVIQTDFQTQFQAYTTLYMWNAVSQPGGIEVFVNWFGTIFSGCQSTQIFEHHPQTPFLHRDTIKILHKILSIYETYSMDFSSYFDMMQRMGEEMGLMKLHEEELDDWVPLIVVKKFARDFITGFIKLMKELHFKPGLYIE
ncbi:hypothetical protein PROFUN_05011 [Planoprotostelium fungivorum]|uniref:Uncharacterized protein n=1 Tax=Planoprotostelium fungivorum TaxID=1890364 RepID=A0A2P6NS55_9EUKA|nr:hypothetical protein PROFUN_05011 [Planoprotostelium fungivorum]